MTALVAAILVAAGGAGWESQGGPAVEVEILGRSSPTAMLVEGGGRAFDLAARDGVLVSGGVEVGQPLRLPAARWRVTVPGEPERTYRGALEIVVADRRLRPTLIVRLERYVAAVIASEAPPGTPMEALRALAVVARSFALAARGRHAHDRLCDLAHCQVLRGYGLAASHVEAADDAARATEGEVLRLRSGAVAEAVFHGACGGHTAEPREAFGGEATGAAAVADPGCSGPRWTARIPADLYLSVAARQLGRAREVSALEGTDGAPSAIDEVELVRGTGGWVVQVRLRGGVARASGDAFARALDGALGWNRIRSSRFWVDPEPGGAVHVSGIGLGHGVGLCQAGAARRAARGESWRAIVKHYFPRAHLASLHDSASLTPGARRRVE